LPISREVKYEQRFPHSMEGLGRLLLGSM